MDGASAKRKTNNLFNFCWFKHRIEAWNIFFHQKKSVTYMYRIVNTKQQNMLQWSVYIKCFKKIHWICYRSFVIFYRLELTIFIWFQCHLTTIFCSFASASLCVPSTTCRKCIKTFIEIQAFACIQPIKRNKSIESFAKKNLIIKHRSRHDTGRSSSGRVLVRQ